MTMSDAPDHSRGRNSAKLTSAPCPGWPTIASWDHTNSPQKRYHASIVKSPASSTSGMSTQPPTSAVSTSGDSTSSADLEPSMKPGWPRTTSLTSSPASEVDDSVSAPSSS